LPARICGRQYKRGSRHMWKTIGYLSALTLGFIILLIVLAIIGLK
jgi:hypothetical protein